MAGGLFFPEIAARYSSLSAVTSLNTATDKQCCTGHILWEDGGNHVVSSAGAQVKFFLNGVTFANGSTTLDVGFQDVDPVNGPVVRGDGTFDVKKTLTGGVDTLTVSVFNTAPMGAGSKTINNGDYVALVFDMTARGGSDSVQLTNLSGPFTSGINARPTMTQFKSSLWGTNGGMPNVFIIADDGAYGIFDGALPIITNTTEAWSDSTNPDERGLIFQLPFNGTIDGGFLTLSPQSNNVNADSRVTLYGDPTGTPVDLGHIDILGENYERAANTWLQFMFSSAISVSKTTDYCLAVKATGSANLSLSYLQLPDTNLRKFVGGTSVKKATRNNGSGAFVPESPATTVYIMGVRVIPSAGGTSYPRSGIQGISEGISR